MKMNEPKDAYRCGIKDEEAGGGLVEQGGKISDITPKTARS
jgi:hypothetical protein